MASRTRGWLAGLVVTGLGWGAFEAGAAERAPTRRGFEEQTRVIAVEVPVNVVDKNGKPVRGLTTADFEIYDEGKQRPISGFEVVDLTLQQPAPGKAPAKLELSPPSRRHFLLLFDLSYSSPAALLRARTAARELVLSRLHPTDLVAVAAFTLEAGPRLLLTFTPDRAQVAQAIDNVGLKRNSQLDPLRFLIAAQPSDSSAEVASADPNALRVLDGLDAEAREQLKVMASLVDRTEKMDKRNQIVAFSRSLGDMAGHLAAVEGRKQILFFSEGFDTRLLTGVPLEDTSQGEGRNLDIQAGNLWFVETDDLFGSTRLQREMAEMISSFRKADCVIQSVDIGGLRADERITDVSATGQGFHSRLNSGQDGLFYMARETGGELFKDATDLSKQLPEVLDRSAITYLLTFQTDELPTTGRFRKLRVKLAGARAKDDLRLAYRQGYFEPRPYPTLAPLEKDLLASDAIASATPLDDVEISLLAAPFRSSPRHAYVAVILELAGTSLLAGHPKESPKLPVEIYAYASNADNEVQGFFSQQINLDVSKGRQKLEGSGLKYYGHLDLKPGSYQLRVLVRNAVTGRTGVTTTALNVPPYETTAPVVLPPFFPEEKPRFFMVRERQPEGQLDSTVYPFTINGEPYVPSALPQVGHSGAAQFYLVGYNLGQGQLALAGELVDAQGGAVSGGEVKLVERTATGIAGYDKLLATFQPPKLPTGLYTLKVALTNPSTGETRSSSIPIEILN